MAYGDWVNEVWRVSDRKLWSITDANAYYAGETIRSSRPEEHFISIGWFKAFRTSFAKTGKITKHLKVSQHDAVLRAAIQREFPDSEVNFKTILVKPVGNPSYHTTNSYRIGYDDYCEDVYYYDYYNIWFERRKIPENETVTQNNSTSTHESEAAKRAAAQAANRAAAEAERARKQAEENMAKVQAADQQTQGLAIANTELRSRISLYRSQIQQTANETSASYQARAALARERSSLEAEIAKTIGSLNRKERAAVLAVCLADASMSSVSNVLINYGVDAGQLAWQAIQKKDAMLINKSMELGADFLQLMAPDGRMLLQHLVEWKNEAHIDNALRSSKSNFFQAAIVVADKNDIATIARMISARPALTSQIISGGCSLLQVAILLDKADVVRKILEMDCSSATVLSRRGDSALKLAVVCENEAIIELVARRATAKAESEQLSGCINEAYRSEILASANSMSRIVQVMKQLHQQSKTSLADEGTKVNYSKRSLAPMLLRLCNSLADEDDTQTVAERVIEFAEPKSSRADDERQMSSELECPQDSADSHKDDFRQEYADECYELKGTSSLDDETGERSQNGIRLVSENSGDELLRKLAELNPDLTISF